MLKMKMPLITPPMKPGPKPRVIEVKAKDPIKKFSTLESLNADLKGF